MSPKKIFSAPSARDYILLSCKIAKKKSWKIEGNVKKKVILGMLKKLHYGNPIFDFLGLNLKIFVLDDTLCSMETPNGLVLWVLWAGIYFLTRRTLHDMADLWVLKQLGKKSNFFVLQNQKRSAQTRGRGVKVWLMAQNHHKTNPLGVSIQLEGV